MGWKRPHRAFSPSPLPRYMYVIWGGGYMYAHSRLALFRGIHSQEYSKEKLTKNTLEGKNGILV
jgi:hypothetical protein